MKKRPTDATMRNVSASKARDAGLKEQIRRLAVLYTYLDKRVAQLERKGLSK